MTAEFSHGSIDDATNTELGSPSREELYEIIGDLHDRIVELQADPRLECTLTAEDLMVEMYEIDDELLLQKVESLSRRVTLWENKKIGDQAVQETIVLPKIRQEVIAGDLLQSDEVLRIREEFLTENVLETFAREWVEDFGELVPSRSVLRKLAKDGKFYSYEEVLSEGGLVKFKEAIDRLYQPIITPYGEPENEISSDYPDTTEVVMTGKYLRTELYGIISDLYQKVAKIENQLEFSRADIDDITPNDLGRYSKAKLKVMADLLCARLNELQKRIVGRTAILRLTEEVPRKPERMHAAVSLRLHMPSEVIRIRERFLQNDMPETMERAAELWRLKFGDELPTEMLLEEMHEQCLYFSPEVIEELGGLEDLQREVKYQESTTLHVPRSDEKSRVPREKSPVIWRFVTIEEAAEDWRQKFPDEMPTRELIKEKHSMGLYATISMIHRLGGITELQLALGYDVMEREKRSIDEEKMNMFVEAWDLLFPDEIPTMKLIDEKYAQKLPGWSWRGKAVVDAGGVKELRRRLEDLYRELPVEDVVEVEEVVERLSTGDMIVVNWVL